MFEIPRDAILAFHQIDPDSAQAKTLTDGDCIQLQDELLETVTLAEYLTWPHPPPPKVDDLGEDEIREVSADYLIRNSVIGSYAHSCGWNRIVEVTWSYPGKGVMMKCIRPDGREVSLSLLFEDTFFIKGPRSKPVEPEPAPMEVKAEFLLNECGTHEIMFCEKWFLAGFARMHDGIVTIDIGEPYHLRFPAEESVEIRPKSAKAI